MKTLKTILTITGLFTALLSHAQTFSGKYVATVTEHFKQGVKASATTKYKPGVITIGKESIKADTSVYTILKHGDIETADEGQFIQPLIVITTTKSGTYKALDCVLLLKKDKTISEVIFKKTKATTVSYIIN